MALYTIGDLHLSQSSNKPMDVFGEGWSRHADRLVDAFSNLNTDDVTVICGDCSWGMSLEESLADFQLINSFPGQKIILKGNHDYWWNTVTKMNAFLKEHQLDSISFLHNNCHFYGGFALCGTRGWPSPEEESEHDELIYRRELMRLEHSFEQAGGRPILCFLHYPPIYQNYRCEEILDLLKKYHVEQCFFGHLHGKSCSMAFNGKENETEFHLISADYLRFVPRKILEN